MIDVYGISECGNYIVCRIKDKEHKVLASSFAGFVHGYIAAADVEPRKPIVAPVYADHIEKLQEKTVGIEAVRSKLAELESLGHKRETLSEIIKKHGVNLPAVAKAGKLDAVMADLGGL